MQGGVKILREDSQLISRRGGRQTEYRMVLKFLGSVTEYNTMGGEKMINLIKLKNLWDKINKEEISTSSLGKFISGS